MSSTPRVSIALGTYNGAAHLAEQIETLLTQTCRDFELLAVDDASTDATAEILHSYAARDSRIRVTVNARNLGYNANFAQAFAACRGTYIAPCDQDDLWDPEKLEALQHAIGDADLAYCDSNLIDITGHALGRRLSDARRMYEGQDPLALLLTNSASGHAMLFRSELLARAQPLPTETLYDWWLAIAAAASGGLRYLDRPLVRFRRHSTAATEIGRTSAGRPLRSYLEGRRKLLRAMARLDGPRRRDIEQLRDALSAGLDRGHWLEFCRLSWRHRGPLSYILRPRLPAVVARALMAPFSSRI